MSSFVESEKKCLVLIVVVVVEVVVNVCLSTCVEMNSVVLFLCMRIQLESFFSSKNCD